MLERCNLIETFHLISKSAQTQSIKAPTRVTLMASVADYVICSAGIRNGAATAGGCCCRLQCVRLKSLRHNQCPEDSNVRLAGSHSIKFLRVWPSSEARSKLTSSPLERVISNLIQGWARAQRCLPDAIL